MNKIEGGSSEGARPTFRPRLEPVPAGGSPFPGTEESNPLASHVLEARVGGHAAPGPRFPGTKPPPDATSGRPPTHRGKNILLASGATIAGLSGIVGAWLGINSRGGSDPDSGSVLPGATVTVDNPSTPRPEPTQKPEVKSSPYNFINQKVYLDGKLTLQAEEHLPTITEGPESIVSGFPNPKQVPYTPSNGLEVNPAYPESAEKTMQGIEVGFLIAWSSQKNIPDSQKDLRTDFDEPRAEQLRKLNLLKQRAAQGEEFNVTLKAYKDDGVVDEDVTINIGDSAYKFKVDELSKPPVQIVVQSNYGGSLRISPSNKEIRIELLDQYRGGVGLFSESVYLANQLSGIISTFKDMVVEDGKPARADYKHPSYDHLANEVKRRNILMGNKYFILGVSEDSNGKDWLSVGGVITPIK